MLCSSLLSFATAEPLTPPQLFDGMIQKLRAVESAMMKQGRASLSEPKGEDSWQLALENLTEPLGHLVNDLYRSGQGNSPPPAYGLRVLISSLRSSRSPQEARHNAIQLIDTISFLRDEYELAHQRKPPPGVSVAPAAARQTLNDILRRSEFKKTTRPHFFEYYLNRFIVRAIAWLQGMFDSSGMRQAGRFAYFVLWAAYALVGAAAFWFLNRAWSPRRLQQVKPLRRATNGIALLTPESHRASAEALRRQGDFGAAIREYFLMMLATIEQRNIVPRNRCWTNWEYLRMLGARVPGEFMRGQLTEINRVYDQVRYGGMVCDESRFVSFREDVDDFLTGLPETEALMKNPP
jgi:hypothetical protein